MELSDIRKQLDVIDNQIADLFLQRMEAVKLVAQTKIERNLPVFDPQRERQKLAALTERVGETMAPATETLFSVIMDLSRSMQHQIIDKQSPIRDSIRKALAETPNMPPERPLVACQGTEGAYSQMACERLFPSANIMYFSTFDSVFSAVEQGLCRYGILPLENSTAGSVNRIYDLMMKHDFYISRSCRVKVDHCLLTKKGVKRSDIREVFSHEQAISQCQGFLKTLKDVKVTACDNTAFAAKMVASSERNDIAALSSRFCADLYNLYCQQASVQDQGSNYTRFICISKQLEIFPGANRTSLMLTVPNRRGSLYRVLSRFNALGINLTKLESRPLSNTNFEFMFYFDLDAPIYSDALMRVFDDLDGSVSNIKYLGSYTEVI